MSVYKPSYLDSNTGKKRQQAVWWYAFTFAGRRIQESSKSTRKTVAVEAEKKRRLELERAMAGLPVERRETRISSVADVTATYLAAHKLNHRPKSTLFAKDRLVHVNRLLGSRYVIDLGEPDILAYMEKRLTEDASGRTINAELGELSRAIGKPWRALWPKVKKLEERHDIGRALEAKEEKALMDAAAKNNSKLIYPFLQVLTWTGMRSDEARVLRWHQVDFEANQITVGRAKSAAGQGRIIPMSGVLRTVLQQHASWCASKLGPLHPDWHVFPFSNRLRPVDATKPATSLKTSWESVRTAAGVSMRLHDWRHTFCTKMAEAGVPEGTMLDMMGHMSASMLRRYSHIRAQARRDAITAIETRGVVNPVSKESTKVGANAAAKPAVSH